MEIKIGLKRTSKLSHWTSLKCFLQDLAWKPAPPLPIWPFSFQVYHSWKMFSMGYVTKKRKLCIFADTHCFFSCPFVCARWFKVRTELSVSFYCLLRLGSPLMVKKKMSVCSLTGFRCLFSKCCKFLNFTCAHERFATGFFKWLITCCLSFLWILILASSCFYHV